MALGYEGMSGTTFSKPERKCRCGHTKDHPMVIPEREYSLWGWVQLSMLGLTPRPSVVLFRCGMCRQVLASTRDPKVLSGEVRADPKQPGAAKAQGTAAASEAPASSPPPEH